MKKCYVCDTLLTAETASNEHIIPNACGGYWQSKELLCRQCNSTFGSECDAALATQANHCTNLLGIIRYRGEPQKIKGKQLSTGEDYVIEASGRPMLAKPTVEEKIENGQPTLSVVARNATELRGILTGYLKRYPQTDVEALMKGAKSTKKYLSEPLTFSLEIGGEKAFRALVKLAINCYLLKGGESLYIKQLIPYLVGRETLKIVWMHYPSSILYTPDSEAITHLIRIIANPGQRILYAYVELFNVYNYLIVLNEEYAGPTLDATYMFDVFKLSEVSAYIPITYSREQVLDFIANTPNEEYIENFRYRFSWILNVAKKRQEEKHVDKLIDQAWAEISSKYPEGVQIDEVMIADINQRVVERLIPFLTRQLRG